MRFNFTYYLKRYLGGDKTKEIHPVHWAVSEAIPQHYKHGQRTSG